MGFFSGFYMVPLYTLLQHRAPKASKGDLVATSNFINVTGAMAASLLFFLLVAAGRFLDITPPIKQESQITGVLESMEKTNRGHIKIVTVKTPDGEITFKAKKTPLPAIEAENLLDFLNHLQNEVVIDYDDGLLEMFGTDVAVGNRVTVSEYKLRGVQHFYLRPEGKDQTAYDNERLPQYLFFGAALMTVGILLLLWGKLPDFFVRALFWLHGLGKYKIKAVGMQHLPATGPVILVTNCDSLESSLQLVAVTDRFTKVILIDGNQVAGKPLLRRLALRRNVVPVAATADDSSWQTVQEGARAVLERGDMLAVGLHGKTVAAPLEDFVHSLCRQTSAPMLPVYCGPLKHTTGDRYVRVIFGAACTCSSTVGDLRHEIEKLAD
jgi:hypothetical protein